MRIPVSTLLFCVTAFFTAFAESPQGCSYDSYPGKCTIIYLDRTTDTIPQKFDVGCEGYEVLLHYFPADGVNFPHAMPGYPPDSVVWHFELENGYHPCTLYIEKYKIEKNKTFDCAAMVATGSSSGSCQEFFFELSGVDRTDCFEQNKASKFTTIVPESKRYFDQALRQLNAGSCQAALDSFNKCLELDPTYAMGYVMRANSYRCSGQLDVEKMVADYTKAIEINPQLQEAYFERAELYWMVGKFEETITDYSALIRFNPEAASYYEKRAICHDYLGQTEAAIRDWKEFLHWCLVDEQCVDMNALKIPRVKKRIKNYENGTWTEPVMKRESEGLGAITDKYGRDISQGKPW